MHSLSGCGITGYLAELAARARAALGDELVGVYAGGSFALGAYLPGRSDLDVAVVSRDELPRATKERLVAAVRHEALPCPARGLELVAYTAAAAAGGAVAAAYEVDLNTGAAMPFRAAFEPDAAASHWYAIDRAVLHARGVALAGPPAAEVFVPAPREQLLAVLAEALRWHEESPDARTDDAVLNACRAWRFASEGVWSSKPDAGAWALGRAEDAGVVADALAAREGGRAPDGARARRFVAGVRRELEL